MPSTAVLDAVREVVDAAGERRKWAALAPSVAAMETRVGAMFRSQSRDVARAVATWQTRWPVAEDALPDKVSEFIARALKRRRGRDAERIRVPLTAAMAAATKVIGSAMYGISFTLEDVGATAYMKARGAVLVRELNKTTVDDLRAILSRGIEEGWSYGRVAKEITAKYASYAAPRGQLGMPTRAHLIAVNENAMAYEASHLAQARELQAAGLPMVKEWGVSADERTCEVCEGNGGEGEIPLEQAFGSGDLMPPAHPGCLLPGNIVAVPRLVAAMRGRYEGPAVEVTLKSGRRLSVTENHPVLTPTGWVAANALREADHVLCCTHPERIASSVHPDHDHTPAAVEQVFSALSEAGTVTTSSVPVSPEDLDGDRRRLHGHIDVVRPDGLLQSNAQPHRLDLLGELPLTGDNMRSCPLLSGGSLAHLLKREWLAAHGIVSGGSEAQALFSAGPGHADAHGLRAPARCDTALLEALPERPPVHPCPLRDFLLRYAGEVEIDQVVEVRDFDATCHVYDLQSDYYGLYSCNGVLVHNCRCWSASRLDPAAEIPEDVTVLGQTPNFAA